jgi:hypothetical protein
MGVGLEGIIIVIQKLMLRRAGENYGVASAGLLKGMIVSRFERLNVRGIGFFEKCIIDKLLLIHSVHHTLSRAGPASLIRVVELSFIP